ncbi:hypothetical protein [Lutimonas sp.]|uniref:hypothetical protein n=1 Tax=Lutimonas sp. TaxID=1872403 RepID=UPI003D9B864E
MRTKFLLILLTLFLTQSYSQDFGTIRLDSELQKKHSDSLKNIGERLNGKWKYLGKSANGSLIDTVGTSSKNGNRSIIIVENGIVFEVEGNKKKKANYYYEIIFSFINGKGFYSREKKYLIDGITEISSDQPIPELVYYKEKFGIVFHQMLGETFNGINELTSERLVLENGKEYLKLE